MRSLGGIRNFATQTTLHNMYIPHEIFNQNKTSIDAPPSSLMDSTASPKMKIVEGEGVGAREPKNEDSGRRRSWGTLLGS